MGKNKRIIQKIRKIWKEQEKIFSEVHKKNDKIIKNFSYKDLKEILTSEMIDLEITKSDLEITESELESIGDKK